MYTYMQSHTHTKIHIQKHTHAKIQHWVIQNTGEKDHRKVGKILNEYRYNHTYYTYIICKTWETMDFLSPVLEPGI